jgi:hypothetical protein
LAGEAEPGEEDNQDKVNFSHDHRRHGRRHGGAGESTRHRNFCHRGLATTGDPRRSLLNVPAGLFRTLSLMGIACKDNL